MAITLVMRLRGQNQKRGIYAMRKWKGKNEGREKKNYQFMRRGNNF